MLAEPKASGHFHIGAAIVSQIAAALVFGIENDWALMAIPAVLFANIFFLIGCYYYVKAKGHHGAWAFFGLLNVFGVLAIVALLSDKHRTTPPSMSPS